jgi:hypothetical protein
MSGLYCEDCLFVGQNTGNGMTTDIPYSGMFVHCYSSTRGFGGLSHGDATGVFIGCIAGNVSFGGREASGYFEDCKVVNDAAADGSSFGNTTSSGRFIRCEGWGKNETTNSWQLASSLFAGGGDSAMLTITSSGYYEECRAGRCSFGASNRPRWTDHDTAVICSGVYIRCIAYTISFGVNIPVDSAPEADSTVTISGYFEDCKIAVYNYDGGSLGSAIAFGHSLAPGVTWCSGIFVRCGVMSNPRAVDSNNTQRAFNLTNSFGYKGYFLGTATDCEAIGDSFGVGYSVGLEKLIRCKSTGRTVPIRGWGGLIQDSVIQCSTPDISALLIIGGVKLFGNTIVSSGTGKAVDGDTSSSSNPITITVGWNRMSTIFGTSRVITNSLGDDAAAGNLINANLVAY